MLKKIVLAILLALPFVSAANVATAEVPFPECLPCPDEGTGGVR
jgi:hypothetical protein